jgi:hypothetical protein
MSRTRRPDKPTRQALRVWIEANTITMPDRDASDTLALINTPTVIHDEHGKPITLPPRFASLYAERAKQHARPAYPDVRDSRTPATIVPVTERRKVRQPRPASISLKDIRHFTITVRQFNGNEIHACDNRERVLQGYARRYWDEQENIIEGWELGTLPPSGLRITDRDAFFSPRELRHRRRETEE